MLTPEPSSQLFCSFCCVFNDDVSFSDEEYSADGRTAGAGGGCRTRRLVEGLPRHLQEPSKRPSG